MTMKKVFFILLTVWGVLSVHAQEPAAGSPQQSIVVARYGTDMQEISQTQETVIAPHKKWWFGIDAAYSYRVAKAADASIKDFVNKMRGGFAYGADIHYAFSRGFGFGARFSGHHYSHSDMTMSDKVNTYYFAPSIGWKNYNRNYSGAFVFGCSIGYVSYQEEVNDLSISKGGLGSTVDIGYDFRLAGSTYLGVKLTLTAGTINTGLRDSGNRELKESLSALDIGVGLRF